MTLLQALVLAVVHGLSEFLPVSPTAHLRIVPALFGWHFYNGTTDDPGAAFIAVVQLGSALALLVYFWRELLQVTVAWVRGLYDRSVRGTLEYRMGWYLILATAPVAVFGLLFRDQIRTGSRNLWVIAGALIGVGVLLFAAERAGRRTRDEEEIGRLDAVAVGAAQAIALVPGASRTGTTITAGLFRGLTRHAAARFSFLIAIPAVVLSAVYEAVGISAKHEPSPGAGVIGFAAVISFVVGLASIHWLLRWLTRHSTYPFICYRIALGVLVIVLLSTGVLGATK